jgi:2-polyprenyl-6-methoxyphenol hydroxylase-like FAD-dependent oxidoreductase
VEALRRYDLVIIGGGPAGASAAITAARAGIQVLLLEKGVFPRHKVCGEFVSGESLQLLNSLLANSLETRSLLARVPRINGVRLFLDGRTVQVPVDPPAASLARFDMDAALWRAAMAAGVETQEETPVLGLEGQGPFQIQINAGWVTARAVINTAGRWSNLTEKPSELASSPKWIGLKAHFTEDSPAPTTDLYFFEGGYCGMQPVGLGEEPATSRIVVCSMVRADVATRLEDVFPCESRLRSAARVGSGSRSWSPRRPLFFGSLLRKETACFTPETPLALSTLSWATEYLLRCAVEHSRRNLCAPSIGGRPAWNRRWQNIAGLTKNAYSRYSGLPHSCAAC